MDGSPTRAAGLHEPPLMPTVPPLTAAEAVPSVSTRTPVPETLTDESAPVTVTPVSVTAIE